MPNLPKPRLRRASRRGELVGPPAAPEPQTPHVEQIDAAGLRWVNIERPGALERTWLEENYDFHALDIEDVLSRNQRPKIDIYDDYLFIVLHLPVFDRAAGRLGTGELDLFVGPDYLITIPNQPLQPIEYLFERCRGEGGAARAALLPRLRLPALPDRRRQLRLLLPDAAQDRQQARRARGRHLRGPLRGDRARHLQRQAGDHQLPQGDPAAAAGAARPREGQAALPRPRHRPRDLLRRHRRRPRADLGHARELQGGRRGARGDQRVGDLPPRQRHPPRADLDQRHRPAADPDREHLGDELSRPRRGRHDRVLGRARRDARDPVGMVAYFRRRGWL